MGIVMDNCFCKNVDHYCCDKVFSCCIDCSTSCIQNCLACNYQACRCPGCSVSCCCAGKGCGRNCWLIPCQRWIISGFYNLCCCEYNCLVFPSSGRSTYLPAQENLIEGKTIRFAHFKVEVCLQKTQKDQSVPYLKMFTKESQKSKKCMIYFHGNAEDLGHTVNFLLPIFTQTQITIFAIQYPTYGCYECDYPWRISDRIKIHSLRFYDEQIIKNRSCRTEEVYVIGRSIGSGPASYLAGNRQIPYLILVSPFDSITDYAWGLCCSLGLVVKNHFNNKEQLAKFKGRLLIIHGKMDQVIGYERGEKLYNSFVGHQNKIDRQKHLMVSPPVMSHNQFILQKDIVNPIASFLSQNTDSVPVAKYSASPAGKFEERNGQKIGRQ